MPVETKEVDKPDTDTTKIGAEGNDAFGAAFGAMAEEVVTDDKTAETQVNKDEGADKVVEKTDADKNSRRW